MSTLISTSGAPSAYMIKHDIAMYALAAYSVIGTTLQLMEFLYRHTIRRQFKALVERVDRLTILRASLQMHMFPIQVASSDIGIRTKRLTDVLLRLNQQMQQTVGLFRYVGTLIKLTRAVKIAIGEADEIHLLLLADINEHIQRDRSGSDTTRSSDGHCPVDIIATGTEVAYPLQQIVVTQPIEAGVEAPAE